jgi:hypothetical protein
MYARESMHGRCQQLRLRRDSMLGSTTNVMQSIEDPWLVSCACLAARLEKRNTLSLQSIDGFRVVCIYSSSLLRQFCSPFSFFSISC